MADLMDPLDSTESYWISRFKGMDELNLHTQFSSEARLNVNIHRHLQYTMDLLDLPCLDMQIDCMDIL